MYIPRASKFDPDANGHFGIFGGRYVPETLMPVLLELEKEYQSLRFNENFWSEVEHYMKDYVGRPSALYYAKNVSQELGAKVYLKREDLNHTGAHKVNNTIVQGLIAKKMGKKRVIAETGAGQHGVATATAAALFGMDCKIYMGAIDVQRQELNVFRMQLLGAEVVPVTDGSSVLKDAVNAALRAWVESVEDTHYILGTAAGPAPFPEMVRDFQAIIGKEAKIQHFEKTGKLPDALVACVGGGSNAIGLFYEFLNDKDVKIYGVEAGGDGVETGRHAAPLNDGRVGVLHGNRTYLMADDDGQILGTHSISAGLDYPGVGPEHSFLKDVERVEYVPCTDEEAMVGFRECTQKEGIIPALESSHAIAYALKLAKTMSKDQSIIVNLSGRGDKDLHTVMKRDGIEI